METEMGRWKDGIKLCIDGKRLFGGNKVADKKTDKGRHVETYASTPCFLRSPPCSTSTICSLHWLGRATTGSCQLPPTPLAMLAP